MSRFLVPPQQIQGGRFTLLGSEARHAALVLRKKIGDEIDLFDGENLSYHGRIDFVSPERMEGVLLSERRTPSAHGLTLVLYQSLIKGPKWDWLVEKASEIGVTRLVPVSAERSTVQLTQDGEKAKIERWQRIALSAAKQCGRRDVMQILAPVTVAEALTDLGSESISLIPWEKEHQHSIRSACAGVTAARVNVFIGPEGGWEPAEVERAQQAGVRAVRLGQHLLRSETAGLVASTLVLAELGDFS